MDDSCIVLERDRETMFTTSSSVSSMLLKVSLYNDSLCRPLRHLADLLV